MLEKDTGSVLLEPRGTCGHKSREPIWGWKGEPKPPGVFRKPCLSYANSSPSKLLIIGGRGSYHGHLSKVLGSLCGGFSGNGGLPGTRSLGVFSSAHCPWQSWNSPGIHHAPPTLSLLFCLGLFCTVSSQTLWFSNAPSLPLFPNTIPPSPEGSAAQSQNEHKQLEKRRAA